MIAFATLFLGLVFGDKPVEVVVGPEVAVVELRLDGEKVGTARGEPWTIACDFGPELAPRLLEAVAFDAENRELGRVSQWLNLPQPRVATSVVIEPPGADGSRIARLSWESVAGATPESVVALLDGRRLTVADPRRIELPPVDEEELHLLQVEMRFEKRAEARIDATFGGVYAEEVSTEMTALPLLATGKRPRPPAMAEVQGWFLENGEKLRVITVEKATAEVVVVMGRAFPYFLEPGTRSRRKGLDLAPDHRLRFLSPRPTESQGVAATFDLFPISPAYDAEVGDLYALLTGIVRPAKGKASRINAALSVAGLAAYESRRRRAVVVIPSSHTEDGEGLGPGQARSYLERLRVPLFVWDPEGSRTAGAWGEARDVGSMKALAAAWAELAEHLDRQWVVWLDGQHLPQEVTLAADVEGFAFP